MSPTGLGLGVALGALVGSGVSVDCGVLTGSGMLVAVGSGARDTDGKLVPLDVKAGDRVLFGKWSGTEVKLNGEDLLIMKEADVMGVIEISEKVKKVA